MSRYRRGGRTCFNRSEGRTKPRRGVVGLLSIIWPRFLAKLVLVVWSLALPAALAAQDTTRVVIEGKLLSNATGQPVSGARIALEELELLAFSDSAGLFVLSGLPLGRYTLSIRADGFRTAEGDFNVMRSGAFTVRLDPLDSHSNRVYGQLRGIVRDRGSERGLESAQVSLSSLSRTALTDTRGRFSFREVPPGSVEMTVQNLGYETRTDTVVVAPGQLVTIEVALSVAPIELEPIRVEVEALLLPLDLVGFYERREAGIGIYLTREQIVSRRPNYTTDLFESLPGVRVMRGSGLDRAVVLRSGARLTLSGPPTLCGPTVYLDGAVVERGGIGSLSAYIDRIIRPEQIAGIEIYTSPATVPLQYKEVGVDCGVIVLWSR